MAAVLIKGFDYRDQKEVAYTAADWRRLFPSPHFRRTCQDGETFYHSPRKLVGKEWVEAAIAAEAYAIIPAGREVPHG
jgi:hypothetical protein